MKTFGDVLHHILDCMVCPWLPGPKLPRLVCVVYCVFGFTVVWGVLVIEEGGLYTSARLTGGDGYAMFGPRLCWRRFLMACDLLNNPIVAVECIDHDHR